MRRSTIVALVALLLFAYLAPCNPTGFIPTAFAPRAFARSHHRRREARAPVGRFDYYVLSLSWSPQHCAEERSDRNDAQCIGPRRYGFIVHGLWPQYGDGGYPRDCSTGHRLPPSVVDRTLDLVPSRDLIRHEWQKHGTCSGFGPDAYFARMRAAFRGIVIPDRYHDPQNAFRVTATSIREEFQAANASLRDADLAVICDGHFLSELRVCLSKDDLTFRNCDRTIRDDCHGEVTVRPLR